MVAPMKAVNQASSVHGLPLSAPNTCCALSMLTPFSEPRAISSA